MEFENTMIGNWKILSFAFSRKGHAYYHSECECGFKGLRRPSRLAKRFNKTGHAGCRKCAGRERARKSDSKKTIEDHWLALFLLKSRSAAYYDHSWDLSFEEYRFLSQSSCRYCGIEPSNFHKVHSTYVNVQLCYQGVDRVDSSKGYHIENCVPCCIQCNKAKNNYSVKDFVSWIKRVAEHQSMGEY